MKKIKIFWIFLWFTLSIFFSQWNELFQLENSLKLPSISHPFGFDPFGRDLLFLQFKAFYQSARLALFATFFIISLSLIIGTSCAFAPKFLKKIFEKTIFFFLSFPSLILALIISSLYGPSWNTLLIALSLGMLPSGIQFTYYRTLDILKEEFILSSRSLGARTPTLIRKHVFPHIFPFLTLKIPYFFSRAMLAEATLSFLGIGAPLGETSMGMLFSLARDYLIEAPWILLFISTPFIFTIYTLMSLSENKTQ